MCSRTSKQVPYLFRSISITNQQPCQHLQRAANQYVSTDVCAFCHLLATHCCYTPHLDSAVGTTQVQIVLVDTDPKSAHGRNIQQNTCFSSAKQTPLNEKHMTCRNSERGEAKSNLERWDRIRCSERLACLSVGTTRWRSATDTSAATSTCWLNTTSCTVAQQILLAVGGSYTNTHADCYLPPALHDGDQLAGNEAETQWRICAAPVKKNTLQMRIHQAATLSCVFGMKN